MKYRIIKYEFLNIYILEEQDMFPFQFLPGIPFWRYKQHGSNIDDLIAIARSYHQKKPCILWEEDI